MSHVDRLLSELTTLLNSNPTEDDLKRNAQLYLAAFIGRVALRDAGYAPLEEIMPVFQDARTAIHKMQIQGNASFIRIELLTDLDKAIATVRPQLLSFPKL